MDIRFGWGKGLQDKDLKYTVTDVSIPFSSSEEYGSGLRNCLPGQINLSLEIVAEPNGNPAAELFEFAKSQQEDAKAKGAGRILMTKEVKGTHARTQDIEFDNAWISSISTGASMHGDKFSVHLSIMAAKVKVSGVEFEDVRRAKLIT